jgi:phthiodiolone/phenolphthiodiolone dimycocerosates ketoreductase
MLRLTGQYGDRWLPGWPMHPDEYRRRREFIAQIAADHQRPAPTSALVIICVLSRSRDHLRAKLDTEPLTKLMGLYANADVWERHGLTHPLGPGCRGFVHVVAHHLKPDHLRELAPTVPVDIVEEVLYLCSAEETRQLHRARRRS